MRELIVSLSICALAACAPGTGRVELRVGTAGLGGAYYPLGQGIASLVTLHAEGLSMVPIVTRGAVENPRLVSSGDLELALTNADLAFFAHRGQDPYPEPLGIAAAGALHPSVLHLIARANGDVESFADLRGKRVAIGPAGGPTVSLARRLLQAHGMTLEDVVPSFLTYSDGFGQLGDGNVDAAFALAGYPAAAVLQTRATQELRFIRLDGSVLSRFIDENPYYYLIEIAAGVYDTGAPATVLAVDNLLIVRAEETPEIVFSMVEAIYGHLADLQRSNAIALQIDPAQSAKLPIPLHPGASRYFDQR